MEDSDINQLIEEFRFQLKNGMISMEKCRNFLNPKNNNHPKIKFLSSIEIGELIGELNPKDLFNEEYIMGSDFREYIFDKDVIVDGFPAMNFSKHEFIQVTFDEEIMGYFQIPESSIFMRPEIFLWVIFNLTKKRDLVDDGRWNIIGYFIHNNTLRAVCVYRNNNKWVCDLRDRVLNYWFKNTMFFNLKL